jgi:hypothetical protein
MTALMECMPGERRARGEVMDSVILNSPPAIRTIYLRRWLPTHSRHSEQIPLFIQEKRKVQQHRRISGGRFS